MKISVSEVMKTDGTVVPIDASLTIDPAEVSADPRLSFSELAVKGEIVNRAGVALLTLESSLPFFARCDRCDREISDLLTFKTELTLVYERNSDEHDYLFVVKDDELDINELVLDSLMLSLPSKQLCREDCKGLCEKCGQDLNEGPCGCPEKEPDPRLLKLKDLF